MMPEAVYRVASVDQWCRDWLDTAASLVKALLVASFLARIPPLSRSISSPSLALSLLQ
jgi:hypothetical protein